MFFLFKYNFLIIGLSKKEIVLKFEVKEIPLTEISTTKGLNSIDLDVLFATAILITF